MTEDHSILITPDQQLRAIQDNALREHERLRRAQDFHDSLADDFDRELLLKSGRRDNPYLGAHHLATVPVDHGTKPDQPVSVGNGYTGRDHAPSYGAVSQDPEPNQQEEPDDN